MRRGLTVLVVALVALLSGCGGVEPLPEPPSHGVLVTDKAFAIPELTLGYEPTPEGKAHGSLRPALDAATITDELARTLRARGSVAEVAVITSSTSTAASPSPASPNTSPATGAATLLVTLEQASLRYDGQTGIFPLKVAFVIGFFPLDVPNYFIASDRYTLVTHGRWKLVDPASAHTIAEGEAEGRQSGVFGDMSRGWHFLGFVRSPGCLDPEDWEKIATALRPGGEQAFATAVAESVEATLGGVATAASPASASPKAASAATGTPDAAASASRPASGE